MANLSCKSDVLLIFKVLTALIFYIYEHFLLLSWWGREIFGDIILVLESQLRGCELSYIVCLLLNWIKVVRINAIIKVIHILVSTYEWVMMNVLIRLEFLNRTVNLLRLLLAMLLVWLLLLLMIVYIYSFILWVKRSSRSYHRHNLGRLNSINWW